jgi:IclR family transcriptional regulator, acetate operon repressor
VARDGVQSFNRSADILDALASGTGPMAAMEISGKVDLPYSTVHRLLSTMSSRGVVSFSEETKRYSLGPKLIFLGEQAKSAFVLQAQPFLDRLCAVTSETAEMGVLEADHIVYVAQAYGTRQVRSFNTVGSRVLPHASALGKVLLAPLGPEKVRRLIGRTGLPSYTDHTITDVDALLADLETVTERGWAVDDEEREEGMVSIAVPALTSVGLLAAFSISGPSARLRPSVRESMADSMLSVAAEFVTAIEEQVHG